MIGRYLVNKLADVSHEQLRIMIMQEVEVNSVGSTDGQSSLKVSILKSLRNSFQHKWTRMDSLKVAARSL